MATLCNVLSSVYGHNFTSLALNLMEWNCEIYTNAYCEQQHVSIVKHL